MGETVSLTPSGPHRHIWFTYTNWRGETADRKVVVYRVEWAATEWHPEPQWILYGFDLERNEERGFAMRDMMNVRHGE